MRILIVILLCSSHAFSQSKIERMRTLLPVSDELSALSPLTPSKAAYDLQNDSLEPVEGLIHHFFLKNGRNPKQPIKNSSILTALARISTQEIGTICSTKQRTTIRIRKTLRRVFLAANCDFGLITYVAFDIPLVKESFQFYYDKNGPDGGFNLYKGKKKPVSTEEEPEPEQIPLESFTLQEVYRKLDRKLGNGEAAQALRRKEIVAIGLYVRIQPKTINRNKIPQARVVVIYGMRRFQYMNRDRKWMKRYK